MQGAHRPILPVAVLGGRVGGDTPLVPVVVVVAFVPTVLAEDGVWLLRDKGVLAFTSHGLRGVAMLCITLYYTVRLRV